MALILDVFVPGIPRPAGSKRGFIVRRKSGKQGVAITDSSGQKGKDWRSSIVGVVTQAWDSAPVEGPLEVTFWFTLPRPKHHYGKKGGEPYLKPDAPLYHTGTPDTLKLARAVEDALTGIVYKDDAQIVMEALSKVYGERPGVDIEIRPL